jgi:hypothetical protein
MTAGFAANAPRVMVKAKAGHQLVCVGEKKLFEPKNGSDGAGKVAMMR